MRAGNSSNDSILPKTGFTVGSGSTLSITMMLLSKSVPYFAYSFPLTRTFAMTRYFDPIFFHHAAELFDGLS